MAENRGSITRSSAAGRARRWTSEVGKFHFPTLIISGRYDLVATPPLAYKMQQLIAGSRVAVFERSGHFPFFEEPEEFTRVVEQFLSGSPSAKRGHWLPF